MRQRFDSRPLVLRRKYTATMRHTVVLEWQSQLRHGLHLFFVIASAVIARNVANQELLDNIGPQILGKLWVGVAFISGFTLLAVGWVARGYDARRVARMIHACIASLMFLAFLVPPNNPTLAIAKYIAMEVSFASMLLAFGIVIGASLGPREAKQVAARVGAGGIAGGVTAGTVLSFGALLLGSNALFMVAAIFAFLPIWWLPQTVSPTRRKRIKRNDVFNESKDVPALSPYGRWVGIATILMVAATSLIEYQYRYIAHQRYDADKMTAFFGFVVGLSCCMTFLFQISVLNILLNKLGLFGTAIVMPGALIICSAIFGFSPGLVSLVLLKVVDSGSNMSLQQATGNLLLAPLNPKARAVWQGRIDGLAKRGGQVIIGIFLAAFPWPPHRLLPFTLLLCALWIVALLVTRVKYVRLLTEMLGSNRSQNDNFNIYDGASLRILETELATATNSAKRAGVILDLLEQAQRQAPDYLLQRIVDADPQGEGATRVIEHLGNFRDTQALLTYAKSAFPQTSIAALMTLYELDTNIAERYSEKVLRSSQEAVTLQAVAAAILASHDTQARQICQKIAQSNNTEAKRVLAQTLGHSHPGEAYKLVPILLALAMDNDSTVSRTAFESLGKHPNDETCQVALNALGRREIRGAAMRALANMGPPVVPNIIRTLDSGPVEPDVISALIWALGRIGTAKVLKGLVKCLTSPIVQIRLSAAVALYTIYRKQPELEIPTEDLNQHYLYEIGYYAKMREASLAPIPDTPAGRLLIHAIKQRAQASLETFFRMLSLRYPEDAMQGAFQAISSRDPRKRQIAMELLDTLIDTPIRDALTEAMGGLRSKPRHRTSLKILHAMAEDRDTFLKSLVKAVFMEMTEHAISNKKDESARHSRGDLTEDREQSEISRKHLNKTGQIMAQTFVNQILELQSLSIFSRSSAEDLAEVATLVKVKRVSKDTVLFREGDAPDAMYLVRSGEITLSRAGKIMDHIGPKESCGVVAILDQLPRELTAITTIDSVLLVLSGDDLLQLLADRPLLMNSVFRALTAVIRSRLDRVALSKNSEEWGW